MPSAVIVQTRPRRSAAPPALVAICAVAAAAVIWLVLGLTRSPSTISRVTVVNPSSAAVEIKVSPGRDTGTLDLGRSTAGTSHTYRDVLDQGETWVFTVSSAGSRLAELVLDRGELARNDWTVRLPADLGDQQAR